MKRLIAGLALTAFAVFARPFGGFGSALDLIYVGILAAGVLLIFSAPDDPGLGGDEK
jgi:hypothetical protein